MRVEKLFTFLKHAAEAIPNFGNLAGMVHDSNVAIAAGDYVALRSIFSRLVAARKSLDTETADESTMWQYVILQDLQHEILHEILHEINKHEIQQNREANRNG